MLQEIGSSPSPCQIKAHVESSEGRTGAPAVHTLLGNVEANEFGLFVALGDFTTSVRNVADGMSNLRLIHGAERWNLIAVPSEDLDGRCRGVVPLQYVVIPEGVEVDRVQLSRSSGA